MADEELRSSDSELGQQVQELAEIQAQLKTAGPSLAGVGQFATKIKDAWSGLSTRGKAITVGVIALIAVSVTMTMGPGELESVDLGDGKTTVEVEDPRIRKILKEHKEDTEHQKEFKYGLEEYKRIGAGYAKSFFMTFDIVFDKNRPTVNQRHRNIHIKGDSTEKYLFNIRMNYRKNWENVDFSLKHDPDGKQTSTHLYIGCAIGWKIGYVEVISNWTKPQQMTNSEYKYLLEAAYNAVSDF
jgi:hypothetical protein